MAYNLPTGVKDIYNALLDDEKTFVTSDQILLFVKEILPDGRPCWTVPNLEQLKEYNKYLKDLEKEE